MQEVCKGTLVATLVCLGRRLAGFEAMEYDSQKPVKNK